MNSIDVFERSTEKKSIKISSNNDWDPLKAIIVGHANSARVPTVDLSTMSFSYASKKISDIKKLEGQLPKNIIDEANEDIEDLVSTLKKLNIKVYRPEQVDTSIEFSTPEWRTTGWYNWCPRDLLLPLNNLIIETPSPTRARYFETRAYHAIMLEAVNSGIEWISAPKPILSNDSYSFEDMTKPTLMDLEPLFDAPNIVRLGKDLLYQVSNSGNKLGFKWLKNLLEPRGYRLHLAENVYSFAHFDSTIIPLRPGLVLLNSTRVNPKNCPKIFEKWEKLYFKDVVDVKYSSFYDGADLPCSPYIALNLLSIDQKTVCIDKDQTYLIKLLESKGIDCIPLPMRHSRVLSGGFHCATLDLHREGELEDYFE